MTLRERIEARLALAEAATPGPWRTTRRVRMPSGDFAILADLAGGETVTLADWLEYADARFIADRSPDRVIAECRADLALLDAIRARNRQVRLGINGVDLAILAAANLDNRYPEDVNA
jgi:hypothetical protein